MAVLRDRTQDREYRLRAKVTIIGRDPASDIVVPSSRTSGRHAMIVKLGNDYFIEDLDSLNGTFVNGQRLQQRAPLQDNDHVELCGLDATFCREETTKQDFEKTMGLPPVVEDLKSGSIVSALEVGENLRLEVKPEDKLRAVLEISRNLGNILELKDVLPKILESLFVIFPQADRGFILLRDAATGQFAPKATRFRKDPGRNTLPISQTIISHAVKTGRAILSIDAGADQRFDFSQSVRLHQIRSIMCVPLLTQSGECLGVVQLDTPDKGHPFRQEDLDVLASASTQAARAVELARMHHELRELEGASRIQKSFLPAERPHVEQMEFFDYYASAQFVGGDYYDYIPLPGNRLAVTLGDVSGKGVSAALLMARLSAAARFCLATEPTAPAAVRRLNTLLDRAGSEGRFVTFAAIVIDLNNFTLTLVNAGHLPPLRRDAKTGDVAEMGEAIAGLPLGIIDRPYEELTLTLEPGDTWLLVTDGITEARNATGELYGPERLKEVIRKALPGPAAVGAAILADVKQFAAGRPQGDDMTVVGFSRK
ncbi:MAG TPA: SpoIIE family protein phosphatase [Gemmataceae bacterium]|nr:SpoIIE family protein phosphatase [Gemmataceae bacterium]